MIWRFAADAVFLVHLAFILFVVFGSLLALRWPRAASIHLPAAVWGAAIEFGGWLCPLTPLENGLRRAAGSLGYGDGFVEHYVVPLVYPAAMSRRLQIVLGIAVVAANMGLYGFVMVRRRRASHGGGDPPTRYGA